jgi:zinc transport system ATP-binding protein
VRDAKGHLHFDHHAHGPHCDHDHAPAKVNQDA